jgi:cell division protein FtsW
MELNNKKYFQIVLFLIVLVGIISVYSASYIYAKENFGSSTYFLTKHIIYLVIGVLASLLISKTKLSFWIQNAYVFQIVIICLMLATFMPGIGLAIKGSQRWISIAGLSLQPGEFLKITMIFSSIKYFQEYSLNTLKENLQKLLYFVIPYTILLIQPDFGTFLITFTILGFVCFMSNFDRKYFYGFAFSGLLLTASLLVMAPYRFKRLLTFLDPWKDPQNSGFQIIQSFLAFANGHIWGQGIGNSHEKLFYLPEAYNDFIFSVIAEETGFLGVITVVCLFLALIYLGIKIAIQTVSKINSTFIITVIFLIGIQAFLNMAVVLGLVPTKGLTLPFISYGGSALITSMILIGYIFSASLEKSQISDSTKAFYSLNGNV